MAEDDFSSTDLGFDVTPDGRGRVYLGEDGSVVTHGHVTEDDLIALGYTDFNGPADADSAAGFPAAQELAQSAEAPTPEGYSFANLLVEGAELLRPESLVTNILLPGFRPDIAGFKLGHALEKEAVAEDGVIFYVPIESGSSRIALAMFVIQRLGLMNGNPLGEYRLAQILTSSDKQAANTRRRLVDSDAILRTGDYIDPNTAEVMPGEILPNPLLERVAAGDQELVKQLNATKLTGKLSVAYEIPGLSEKEQQAWVAFSTAARAEIRTHFPEYNGNVNIVPVPVLPRNFEEMTADFAKKLELAGGVTTNVQAGRKIFGDSLLWINNYFGGYDEKLNHAVTILSQFKNLDEDESGLVKVQMLDLIEPLRVISDGVLITERGTTHPIITLLRMMTNPSEKRSSEVLSHILYLNNAVYYGLKSALETYTGRKLSAEDIEYCLNSSQDIASSVKAKSFSNSDSMAVNFMLLSQLGLVAQMSAALKGRAGDDIFNTLIAKAMAQQANPGSKMTGKESPQKSKSNKKRR